MMSFATDIEAGIMTIALAAALMAGGGEANMIGGLNCSPSRLGPRDVLRIVLPAHHHGDMRALTPAGRRIWLANVDHAGLVAVLGPLAQNGLRSVSVWGGRADSLFGADARTQRRLPVFRESGSYRFQVSGNLETEDPILDGWCTVSYDRHRAARLPPGR